MAATKGMKTGRAAGGGTKEKLSCRLVTAPKMKGRKEGRKEGGLETFKGAVKRG